MVVSDIKRFDCTNGKAIFCYGCYTMDEDTDGEYVLHEDYEQLQKELDELNAEARRLETLIDKNNCLVQHSCDQVCADFLKYGKHRHAPNCPTEFFIDITAHRGEV